MKTFTQIALQEKTKDEIYFVKDELWIAYGQGSGQTVQFPNLKKYITNKSDDKNFDSSTDRIVKYANGTKPFKQTKSKNNKMFKLPVYPLAPMGKSYDIWGGDIKPIKEYYLIVSTQGHAVVNIFDNKNEATSWIKSTS